MRLNFNLNNEVEMPELILGTRNYKKLGSITNVENLSCEYNLMSADKINFTVHKSFDQKECVLWDELRDMRLVFVRELNEWFQIAVATDETDELKKTITGTSLCEAELGQILIFGAEINTENDIARDDYEAAVFYHPASPSASLLHRLLKKAPNYSIKHVDKSLWNIQRTFQIDNKSVYDALTGEIAGEIGCVFLFDSTDRSISVYDLMTTCNHCGYRGDFTDICPNILEEEGHICGSTDLTPGYGYDTSILVDSENLAENISLEGNSEERKNYFRITGGDDIITASVAACNPAGSNDIYAFSEDDKKDMSEELCEKLDSYEQLYQEKEPLYTEIMGQLYDVIDEELKLKSLMMPDITQAETTAAGELAKLIPGNLSPVAVTDVSTASVYTANNAVLAMAKCLVNSTVYKVTLLDDSTSLEGQLWRGKFRLENYSDETDCVENTEAIQITIDDDYEHYVKQKIQKTIDRDDIYLTDIFDKNVSLDIFKSELKKYCLNRLTSFDSAYESVLYVLTEANCADNSIYGDIYTSLYLPYYYRHCAIQEEIKIRSDEIAAVEERYHTLTTSQKEIQNELNLENYLGEELWKELCSFRREDTYENSNYISDGLNNNEILEKAQKLLKEARKHAAAASTLQLSLSASMYNLLAMPEFQELTSKFEGGNWIRVRVDDKLYRLRLIHYTIDFSNVQSINVEFSDVTRTANGLSDISSLMGKVQSMASNFSYVARQAEQGAKGFTAIDQIRNDGLNAALYHISNSTDQEFKIDEHGLLGRKWDDILGGYLPEQFKINHNLLVYTDNYWETAKAALGRISYFHPVAKEYRESYGLLADAVISGILMGNELVGGNLYSENYTAASGTHIDLNNGDFTFAGGKLAYDSEKDTLSLTGKITFEEIDYTDDETKQSIRDSLGITEVDGKAQIFTSKPEHYKKNDLWIIGEDYIPSSISGVKTGYILTAVNDNSIYTETDWILSVKYTDDTIALQAVSDNILTPAEKREINNEFHNITSTYNKLISIISAADSSYYSLNNNQTFLQYKTSYADLQNALNTSYGLSDELIGTTTVLTLSQTEEFINLFHSYYLLENEVGKLIQSVSDADIKSAQNTAEEAQKNAQEALGLLADIASDNRITPVEKLLLEEKFKNITSGMEALTEKYSESDYISSDEYQNYLSGCQRFYHMLYGSAEHDSSSYFSSLRIYSQDAYPSEKPIPDYTSSSPDYDEYIGFIWQRDQNKYMQYRRTFEKGSCVYGWYDVDYGYYPAMGSVLVMEIIIKGYSIAGRDFINIYSVLPSRPEDYDIFIPVTDSGEYSVNSAYYYREGVWTSVFSDNEEAYNALLSFLHRDKYKAILTDMETAYTLEAPNYTREEYLTIIDECYKRYQLFVNKVTTDMQSSIDSVSGIADKVQQSLGWTTQIDKKSVISPYIGGGYLNISADSRGSVTIDPMGITNSSYIFSVYNSSDTLVMGVDTGGNGMFSGKIHATSGNIGLWNINSSAIYKSSSVFGASNGMYFGSNGLSIGSTFKITSAGTLQSGSSTEYVSLDSGALKFYSNGTSTATFSDTTWKGTSTYGTAVQLEDASRFVSFGRKAAGASSYITSFLINYGLNPGGRTENVICFGDFLTEGQITADGSYHLNEPGVLNLSSGRVHAWNGTAWGINNSETGTGLYVFGNIGCSGTKERIIQTKHYGAVELNAYETTTPYFGDIGSGQCDEYGLCYIYFDEIFKETILTDCKYYIFLQQYGETPVYPVEKNENYFVVKGMPYQKFDFEIKARQCGTENMRLDRAGDKIESEE